MTIDELARRTGTTSRNIRLYRTEGLLPAPSLNGRVAAYTDDHLSRLKLIARLQRRGFSFASMRELFDAWDERRGLGGILGIGERIVGGWNEERPRAFAMRELAKRFPRGTDVRTLVNRSVKAGLAEMRDGKVYFARPSLLRAAEELIGAGVPVRAACDELERVQGRIGKIAEGFANLFAAHIWGPASRSGLSAERMREIAETLERLRPAATLAIQAILSQELERAAAKKAAQEAAKFRRTTRSASRDLPRQHR
ncbi:MAG: MerR family transcriptional regulator [Candidatus Binataceae bacterium]